MRAILSSFTLLLIAAPVLVFAWAYGGSRAGVLAQVMPWASLACAVGLFILPQRHENEGGLAAIRRVAVGVLKDPFFWIALVLVGYLLYPLYNVGLCPGCDWQAIDAGADPYPPHRYLPFCVNAAEHRGVVWLFAPALLAALGIRHGLTRAGKRAYLGVLVWNGAALAVLGFVQLMTGARFPYWEQVEHTTVFFSVFGYPNMGGAYFAVMYAISLGFWCERMGHVERQPLALKEGAAVPRHPFVGTHYPFLAVVLNLCGLLGTLCRAAIILAVALSAIFFAYMLARAFSGSDWRRGRRFKHAVVSCALMLAFFAVVYVYAPVEVGRELGTVNMAGVADRVSGKAQYHTRVASAIMRDFPLFGVGGWGYRHFSPSYMKPAELSQRQTQGGANVHNDYLQFLAEHGLVGFSLLVACVWLLALPSGRGWKAVAQEALKTRSSMQAGPGDSAYVLFSVSPAVLWSFLGCVAVLVHAFGDCPFRSGAVMSTFLALLPVSYGFIPRQQVKSETAF